MAPAAPDRPLLSAQNTKDSRKKNTGTKNRPTTAMKARPSVNATSDDWNRCTANASAYVGGCSTKDIGVSGRTRITRISSHSIAPSQLTSRTGQVSVNTLEKPELPGWNGRLSSWRICTTTAATPSSSATKAAACQALLDPALIRCSPTYCTTALSRTR